MPPYYYSYLAVVTIEGEWDWERKEAGKSGLHSQCAVWLVRYATSWNEAAVQCSAAVT